MNLAEFVRESNRIENIRRNPTRNEIDAHKLFLGLDYIVIADLERFVSIVAHAPLREHFGMDVYVGNHKPPPGGPGIRLALGALLVNPLLGTPWRVHAAYEALHPFMDGNGRSGRVLWAWHMNKLADTTSPGPFDLPFLHQAYYQALEATRELSEERQ